MLLFNVLAVSCVHPIYFSSPRGHVASEFPPAVSPATIQVNLKPHLSTKLSWPITLMFSSAEMHDLC